MVISKPLRVGLIGAGMVSIHHLEAWSRIDEAEVVAIADPDRNRAFTRAAAFNVEHVFQDAADLLAGMEIDAVDIAAPVAAHGTLCRMAADLGVHILCQKPLAETLDEAQQLVVDVGSRVRLMVHENWRFRAHYRQLKKWLENRRIGSVTGASMNVRSSGLVRNGSGLLPALERQPFLATLPRLLVFEVLVHHLDVLRWLFGDLEVMSADLMYTCDQVIGEDGANIHVRNESGLTIILNADFCDPNAPLHVSDSLKVNGARGTIDLSDTQLALRGDSPINLQWSFDDLYSGSYEGALREFTTAIRTGRHFESSVYDNLQTLLLVEGVYSKAKSQTLK